MDYESIIALVKQTKSLIVSEDMRHDVHMKGFADFVTATDIAISNFLKKELQDRYPDIGFFCEEEDGQLSDPSWILDPIDGTTNYVYGYPLSTVSLALYEGGQVVFGVVYNPYSDECFTAQKGKGAWVNGRRLSVIKREMKDSIVEFGAGSSRKADADINFAIAKDIFKNCIDIRRICSSALDLCFMADGRIDGYFEQHLKPWDYAAGSLILTEAGGMLTDYDGQPLPMDRPSSIIASNGVIHREIQQIIGRYKKS